VSERVQITSWETAFALAVARARHGYAIRDERCNRYGPSLTAHVTGAIGELVIAKNLGVYWCPRCSSLDHDIGDVAGYQVRATARMPGELRIRDNDRGDDVFVLVAGEPPVLTIAGWMTANEAREIGERKRWNDGPLATYVAAAVLHAWHERPYLEIGVAS